MAKFDKITKLPDIQIGQGRKNVFAPAPIEQPKSASQPLQKPSAKPQAAEATAVVKNLVFEQRERGRSINLYLRPSTIAKLEAAAEARGVKPSKLLETLLNQVL